VKSFALEPIEKASLDELKALQLERLRWSLDHAYRNVARYRQKFDAVGVKPADCRSLADLAKFPFTTKADLRDTYPFGMFAVTMDRIVRIHASSARPASRPSSATPRRTSIPGRTSWRARCAPPGRARATRCTWPTATAFSPAASARTTAPSASASP
jgi:hypothetical protein